MPERHGGRVGLLPPGLPADHLADPVRARVDLERVVAVGVGDVGQVDRVALAVGAARWIVQPARPQLGRVAHAVGVQVVELGARLGRLWKLPKSLPLVDLTREVKTMSQSPSPGMSRERLRPARLLRLRHRVAARVDAERVVAVSAVGGVGRLTASPCPSVPTRWIFDAGRVPGSPASRTPSAFRSLNLVPDLVAFWKLPKSLPLSDLARGQRRCPSRRRPGCRGRTGSSPPAASSDTV